MFVINGTEVLRIAMISGFVGFLIFCVSYASAVWLKRNRSNSQHPLIYRLGLILIVLGLFGLAGGWAVNRFSEREGIVDGADLFVVHAKRDAVAYELVSKGHVTPGAIIAEFHHPGIESEIRVIDSRIKEERAQVKALQSQPLQINPMLLQKQAQLRAQVDQQKQFQFDLQRAKDDLEVQKPSLATTWAKEKDQIEAEVGAVHTTLEALPARMKIALKQWDRVNELRRRGLSSNQVVDDRAASMLGLNLERDTLNVALASLTRRAALLDEHNGETSKVVEAEISTVNSDAEIIVRSLASLTSEYQVIEKMIIEDRDRAKDATDRKVEAANQRVETLIAEREKALAVTQVKAPFKGHVVYRHSAPGLAQVGAPVLAISTGTGFTAKVLMSASEIKEVAVAGEVKFALDNPVLRKYFGGTFRKVEQAPFEQNRVLAHFNAELPAEAIAPLGDARESLRVRLMWQPPLLVNTGFQASLGLFAIGCLLMAAASLWLGKRRQFLRPIPPLHAFTSVERAAIEIEKKRGRAA